MTRQVTQRTEVDIESFKYIYRNIIKRKFTKPEELYVCILAVHALGLPEVQDRIVFSKNAIEAGIQALRDRAHIV